jgi:hypothetical protein
MFILPHTSAEQVHKIFSKMFAVENHNDVGTWGAILFQCMGSLPQLVKSEMAQEDVA